MPEVTRHIEASPGSAVMLAVATCDVGHRDEKCAIRCKPVKEFEQRFLKVRHMLQHVPECYRVAGLRRYRVNRIIYIRELRRRDVSSCFRGFDTIGFPTDALCVKEEFSGPAAEVENCPLLLKAAQKVDFPFYSEAAGKAVHMADQACGPG